MKLIMSTEITIQSQLAAGVNIYKLELALLFPYFCQLQSPFGTYVLIVLHVARHYYNFVSVFVSFITKFETTNEEKKTKKETLTDTHTTCQIKRRVWYIYI
jgi:hypothetical protein